MSDKFYKVIGEKAYDGIGELLVPTIRGDVKARYGDTILTLQELDETGPTGETRFVIPFELRDAIYDIPPVVEESVGGESSLVDEQVGAETGDAGSASDLDFGDIR